MEISSSLDGENLRLIWREEGGPRIAKRPGKRDLEVY